MKKILFLAIISITTLITVNGQRLIIGEKAPEMRISEWLSDKPSDNRASLIEFFHSSNQQCNERLPYLNTLAQTHGNKLVVIVISKETKEHAVADLSPASRSYYVALDENGKTFENFGVQFVPFCVLLNSRGRVVWFGNPASLDEDTIKSVTR